MRLNLTWDANDQEIRKGILFAEHRLYAARSFIPEGFERYFQETAQYLSAHTSTAIEGNPLGEEKAMLVLVEGADPNNPAEVEKVNLSEAYELAGRLAEDPTTEIDQGIIRTVNSMVLKNLPDSKSRNRGKYRPGPSLIVDADTREVRYRPPREVWVPELMENLTMDMREWRGVFPAPVAAGLAHFGLISIHPFEDGNGRTARLIADMVLRLADWGSARNMISISGAIHARLAEYYKSLRVTQGSDFIEDVDATPFIRFHTEAIGMAAAKLEEKAIAFSRQRDQFGRRVGDGLNERQVTGLMFMIHLGPISTSRYAQLTESSNATGLADLNSLIEYGLVKRSGAGKNTRYRLTPSLERGIKTARKGRQSRKPSGESMPS